MRLTAAQISAIRSASFEAFSPSVNVWLFGSRVDDRKRGGDIDLLIQPDMAITEPVFSKQIRFLTHLERSLGERKIDVVIETPNDTRPIVAMAHATGIKIV